MCGQSASAMAGGDYGRSIRPPVYAGDNEYIITFSLGAAIGESTGDCERDAFRTARRWVTRQRSPLACPARSSQTARQRARSTNAGRAAGRVGSEQRNAPSEREQACGAGKCCMEMLHGNARKMLPKATHRNSHE